MNRGAGNDEWQKDQASSGAREVSSVGLWTWRAGSVSDRSKRSLCTLTPVADAPGSPDTYATNSLITFDGSTPVRRWSSPWYLNVNFSWSSPSKLSTVAWKSWMWQGSFTML